MSDAKVKKNFFNKPKWLGDKVKSDVKSEVKPEQQKDATQMFARSSGTITDALAEQKRKEQLKEEKKVQAAKKEAEARWAKRRRTSEDGDYKADRDEKKDSISPRRTTRQSTQNSPKPLSKRYEHVLNDLKKQNDAIQISDGSDSDSTLDFKAKKSDVRAKRKQAEEDDSQKDEEDEAFPELAAKARERARQQEEERKQSLARSADNGDDTAAISASPAYTGPNPTLDILVYSDIEGTSALMVKRKWNQNFRDIRKAWLDRQPALTDKVKGEIYFTWRNKKVFDVATCQNLGIKLDEYGNALIPNDQGPYKDTNDRIVLVATTDAQVKLEKEQEEAERRRKEKEEEEAETPPVQAKNDGQIRIILKAKDYAEQKLIVPKETKAGRLIGAYRSKNGIPESKSITLLFDGEDLEPEMTLEDVDVEDMDMIEVRIR